jgi:AcrR family transcriptional regulator
MTADDGDLGLRERKKRETRLALSQATIGLTLRRGWANVTVEDIAAAANVSVRTFRNYFSSKAEAVAASHLERSLRTAEDLRARPAGEPLWDAIIETVRIQFEGQPGSAPAVPRSQGQMDAIQLMLTEPALHGEILKATAIAQEELAKAVAERTGTDVTRDVYPGLVAAVVNAGSAKAVEHWLRTDPTGSVVPFLRDVFEQITAGLPVP